MQKKQQESINQEAYWKQNFTNKDIVASSNDLQLNIARTKSGEVIDAESWKNTLNYISDLLKIENESTVLELCCGNGVIIGEIAKSCKEAIGIDYSPVLLEQLRLNYPLENLTVYCQDVMEVELNPVYFDHIILYFSIQHFSERDAFLLIEKCISALKNDGRILIGDIPDLDKKWSYINKPEHHIDYFNRLKEVRPKIGYWYKRDFFNAMNSVFREVRFEIHDQPEYQINSDHCFDVLIIKP